MDTLQERLMFVVSNIIYKITIFNINYNDIINIKIIAPIRNITVEGTNWIQPWDMLSLNVTCKGSGPFNKCLQFQRGKYNVTGNETCNNIDNLYSCNFSIIHYFLEPSIYTILIILNNDVSKQIYPLTINIYKGIYYYINNNNNNNNINFILL